MKPILFDENATAYTSNGLGRLDCISCLVTEERNGQYELEAVIPEGSLHADQVVMNSIIVVTPADGVSLQAFRVYKITKPINGKFSVYAQHITYQLSYIPTMPFSVNASAQACAQTLAALKSNAAEACPFSFSTDVTTVSSYAQDAPASIRSRLAGVKGSVLDRFGGEYEWNNWNVVLHSNRGRVTPEVSLRYGKNITDLTQEQYISNTITGVCPFWASMDSDTVITLPEKVVESQYADSYPFRRTVPLDLSQDFETQPTADQIRNAARAYVNQSGIGIPTVSIKVSFVALQQTEEYKDVAELQHVKLCDVVRVVFEKLGISTTAKVVKTVWNVLKEKYDSIEIGALHSTLISAINATTGALEAAEDSIRYTVRKVTDELKDEIYNATAWLTSSNGYVIAVKNVDGTWKELIFADHNDPAQWHNLLRINENGIGFSANGGQTYQQAWTLDGKLVIGGTNVPSLTVYKSDASGAAIMFKVSRSGIQWDVNNSKMTEDGVLTMLAGAIRLGRISAGNYNFSVENDGTLTIKKGSISLGAIQGGGYNFTVDNNGNVAIKSGSININNGQFKVDSNGNLTARAGAFTGAITGSTFRGGSIGIGNGTSYNYFVVDSNGNVTIKGGSININNGVFKVDSDGKLTATSGTFSGAVSGSTIRGGSIGIGGNNNDQFTVDTNGNVAIKKGSIKINNGQFEVDSNGNMTAKSGTFKGTLNGGTVTGSTISGNAITGGSIGIGGNNNDNFKVASDGSVTIKKGSINLNNGKFTVSNEGEVKSVGDATNGTTTINGGRIENGFTKIWKGYIQTWYLGITDENGNVQGAWTAHYADGHTLWTGAGINVGSEYETPSYFNTDVTVYATCHANHFDDMSDRRVKKNIKDLIVEKAKKFIMALKPKSFQFNKKCKNSDDSVHHGFIAQDVEQIADWDVVTNRDDGMKGIIYTEIIADLVSVVQDQERRIADLERRMNAIDKS